MEILKQVEGGFNTAVEYVKDKENRWIIIVPVAIVLLALFLFGAFKNKKKFARAMRGARKRGMRIGRRMSYRRRRY